MFDTYANAAEAIADRAQQRAHGIELAVTGHGARSPIYRVMHAGEVMLEGCRCPIFEACRALLTRGITGRLEAWRPSRPSADVQLDIEEGARLTISETDGRGLRVVPWNPRPEDALPVTVPYATGASPGGR